MRGAPQVGFSATMRKIKARTSLLTRFRPPTCLTLEIHAQYKRNPVRCQFTTVLGEIKTRGFLHPPPGPERSQHNPEQLVHGSQSTARSLRMQSQQLSTESQVFKDEVLAGAESADHPADEMPPRSWQEYYRKSPNRALRQVIHFVSVRRFGEAQGKPLVSKH
jgi:hypothetical protein